MTKKEKILIAGGTGLIGKRLIEYLPEDKYNINILSRSADLSQDNVSYYKWDPSKQEIDIEAVKVDHIINLTGAGIADKRWSEKRKKVIIESRVNSLRLLNKALKTANHRTKSIISASAIGYYGNRKNEILSESSNPGTGFMAECCVQWEKAAQELRSKTARLNILRIGVVLSIQGGALPKVLMTKKANVLNYFGSGHQYYSWIHIDDLCKIINEIICNNQYQGKFNAVSPVPVTNKQFTKEIGKGLNNRFLYLPVPSSILRLIMGEMADVVLDSNRVFPIRLQEKGFTFDHEDLAEAIHHLSKAKI